MGIQRFSGLGIVVLFCYLSNRYIFQFSRKTGLNCSIKVKITDYSGSEGQKMLYLMDQYLLGTMQ